ncbi:MAG: hypothetical protein PHI20_03380 [Endomicrobiaceae bacterium]|jgi:hypothetical protein|nr:hypothetical protein [Endomicrobiaceae bacterium]MDD3730060.1 hypothetical protein [Endomicrobiaceae bacterium]MDD4165704.1 hypothetical protein [Endomicrobiaceae bacterium]
MNKVYLLALSTMCLFLSAGTIKAEEANILSGWKLSGDATAFASFKAEERTADSKLNFSYMQFYAEKQIQKDMTVYLSLVVNNKEYNNDQNNYETTVLVDTAFLSYALNDVLSVHVGREIINYGYENPICIIDEKFAMLPAMSLSYFGGYVLRGDGVGLVVRNSVVDVNAAYMNIPTDNSINGKSYYARVSKALGSLTLGVNGLFAKGPDSATQSDGVSYFGPDIKFQNDLLDFRTELVFANRETDFGSGTESVNRLGFYSQVTVNLLSARKLYVGSRLDYVEPYTSYDKVINRYLSGVVGSYLYNNVLARVQFKSNIDEGKDSEAGLMLTVTF